jgi:predicted O-methyltransferase YrrM
MNQVDFVHKVQQLGEKSPRLNRVLDAEFTKRTYGLARLAIRHYHDHVIPSGRFEWASTESLANEAIRRGAMQKQAELGALLGALVGKQIKNALEIGTANGGTFFALAHIAMPDARLTSIDLPGGKFGGGYTTRGKQRIESYTLPTQQVGLFQADSHSPQTYEQVAGWLNGDPLDFLLIDGDHSKTGVEQDWEMYSPLVGQGGLVAFHDIAPHEADPKCQVAEVWRDIRTSRDTLEFVEPPTSDGAGRWGGIGVAMIN